MFSRDKVAWPSAGGATEFDATFSSGQPQGVAPPRTEFSGQIFDAGGVELPPGTRVAAYIGDVRCGMASTRRAGNYTGFSLSVVGPDSVPGCTHNATIRFRVDDRPVAETTINDLSQNRTIDLTTP